MGKDGCIISHLQEDVVSQNVSRWCAHIVWRMLIHGPHYVHDALSLQKITQYATQNRNRYESISMTVMSVVAMRCWIQHQDGG
jgi:hypothetical protein